MTANPRRSIFRYVESLPVVHNCKPFEKMGKRVPAESNPRSTPPSSILSHKKLEIL
jgi:hypothetical protein